MTARTVKAWYWTLCASFLAGALSALMFHQGLIWGAIKFGIAPGVAITPWDLDPVPPLGVPAVVSLAFWSGLWGSLLWAVIRKMRPSAQSIAAIILGATAPTAVAMLVIFPLKGLAVNEAVITAGLVLNAVWGVGCLALIRIFNLFRPEFKPEIGHFVDGDRNRPMD